MKSVSFFWVATNLFSIEHIEFMMVNGKEAFTAQFIFLFSFAQTKWVIFAKILLNFNQ